MVLAAAVGKRVYTLIKLRELLRSRVETLDDHRVTGWLSNAVRASHYFSPWLPEGGSAERRSLSPEEVFNITAMLEVGVASQPDSVSLQFQDRELAEARFREDLRDLGLCIASVLVALLVLHRKNGVWLGLLLLMVQATTLASLTIDGVTMRSNRASGWVSR